MPKAAAIGTHFLERVWHFIPSLTHHWRAKARPERLGSASADSLPAARLRDLGFEADQVGGSIDFAKGQHQHWGRS